MGHGLGDDATLGGILPGVIQEDWDFKGEPCNRVDIPAGTIILDGDLGDWTNLSISPVSTDMTGDGVPGFPGTDIESLYAAKDNDFLYLAISLNDGPPNQNVRYAASAAQQYNNHIPGDKTTEVYYDFINQAWVAQVSIDGISQTPETYPGNAVPGTDAIEWKIPLADMGNIAGRFVVFYSYSGYAYFKHDEYFTCLRIGPITSISGTLNVPSGDDGTGPVFISVYRYDGNLKTAPEKRLGGIIVYHEEYSPGMSYSVNGLPVGEDIFIAVWWDADYNGLVTPRDYLFKTGPYIVAEDGSTVVDTMVDLADLILVLQVLAGLDPEGVHLRGDVNGNSIVDLADAIYILQIIVNLR